ncbi:metallophosphoesterase family protein [Aureimonas mangrovi]|uniref:metallophosphoesterase family protein n=1 Tax=Aureimonas mangrovi TaxID=2758041 RepID=UPI00163D8AC7|nr:metallophosphoesterase family protein [Aureimonas mangrovi]
MISGRRRYSLSAQPHVTYAVGDVHGCFDKLLELEAAIVSDAALFQGVKLIVMMGDYVDRGARSDAVIEHLIGPAPEGFHRICLCGNHDWAFHALLDGTLPVERALALGVEATLEAYGCDLREYHRGLHLNQRRLQQELATFVPERHRAFLRALPVLLEMPNHLFVHAGIRPGVPIADQSEDDLLWIREPFLALSQPLPKIVVHGHTPLERPLADGRRIAVDTGACYGGALTAARITRDGAVGFLSV